MSKYTGKLFFQFIFLLVILMLAAANWFWPFFLWFGDTPVLRFVWLGIFFVLLDIFIEILTGSAKEFSLIGESMGFSRDIHKLSDGFKLASKVSLPNNLKADFVAIGSSGVWMVNVKDDDGKVVFDGDELIQKGTVLRGMITKSLESSYALAEFLKKNLNRDFKVSPVIAFSSFRANVDEVPKMVKGVYISSRKDINSLIENTDVQLVDKNLAEEIYKLLKK